ncbi:hypothetical protein CLOM_g7062 [Closterium sp. NIES-68]|nr:hypothetical protein CLOM_g7062 [Closterium sp. NIES-68]GJP60128.1 hypothetical protein CLOP_g17263 [Closterium sp. NIES-67]GJP76295.1 hypothetical protein CLOP_g6669 [Closterium sp. NIES-67]
MAARALFLVCIALLLATSALAAQRGPPGGVRPGGQGQGGQRGGPGGPGGKGGPGGPPGPRGPPLNLTAVGNLTADVGGRLANCSADQTVLDGGFHLAIFKNATGNFNILAEALLVNASGGPPDSLAIVQGTVCDSSASAAALLTLPFTASDWQQRAGWWLLHAEARLDAFLENVDVATVDALLALLPNASLPAARGSSGSGASGGNAGGVRSGQGSRRMGLGMGRELLMRAAGRVTGGRQGGQQQGPPAGGAGGIMAGGGGSGGVNATVSGYAVLATATAAGVAWGGQLMGVKMPAAA